MPREPGSPEARGLGCTCSPHMNRDGKGAGENYRGDILFLTDAYCPMHGDEKAQERARKKSEKSHGR